ALGQVLVTSVVIYAACIASNTARAMMLAVGMFLAAGCVMKIGHTVALAYLDIWRQFAAALGPNHLPIGYEVFYLYPVAVLLLLCLFQGFAAACYRTRGLTPRQFATQAPALVLSVCLLSIVFVVLLR